MVIVTVKSNPKPEFKSDFLKAFNEVAREVRQEEGCMEYQIYQKDKDSTDLFVFERWESRDHLDAHLKTDHMAKFFEKTGDWFAEEKELKIYEVKE